MTPCLDAARDSGRPISVPAAASGLARGRAMLRRPLGRPPRPGIGARYWRVPSGSRRGAPPAQSWSGDCKRSTGPAASPGEFCPRRTELRCRCLNAAMLPSAGADGQESQSHRSSRDVPIRSRLSRAPLTGALGRSHVREPQRTGGSAPDPRQTNEAQQPRVALSLSARYGAVGAIDAAAPGGRRNCSAASLAPELRQPLETPYGVAGCGAALRALQDRDGVVEPADKAEVETAVVLIAIESGAPHRHSCRQAGGAETTPPSPRRRAPPRSPCRAAGLRPSTGAAPRVPTSRHRD